MDNFNSQPHEEADTSGRWLQVRLSYFNSQPHEEADCLCHAVCSFRNISTHSLTKRLTYLQKRNYLYIIFQLTASRRGWLIQPIANLFICIFQLTASRRGWHWIGSPYVWDDLFQLTASRRGWRFWLWMSTGNIVFQLTASRRGWRYTGPPPYSVIIFQLTASRRGWQLTGAIRSLPLRHFNSQPHEEADLYLLIVKTK